MSDNAVTPESFWLVNCGATQFTIADDPTGDISSALQQGRALVTLDDPWHGETTLVVAKIEAWWKETPDARAAAFRFRKALRDEERVVTGYEDDTA